MAKKRIIHWFRRDLRLDDNTAFSAACAEADEVLPVFVFDSEELRRPDASAERAAFLLDCLRDLDESLRAQGSRLVIRRGDPENELDRLVAETGAEAVFVNRDMSPETRAQGKRLTERLAAQGCRVRSFQDATLQDPRAVLTKAGTPYTVFTPYKKSVLAAPVRRVEATEPWFRPCPDVSSLPVPSLSELGFSTAATLPVGGAGQATRMLDEFARSGMDSYGVRRDLPGVEGTSRLSPYFRFGCLSIRRAFWTAFERRHDDRLGAEARASVETWISELVWRDFYTQILYHFPHVERGAFKSAYNGLEWDDSRERFERWRSGTTGFPIVDAGMRQLDATGWMHNRARMIVASFLTKDLLLNWQWGERYFMNRLVDGDLAANNGGWQWAASTGTDAQPYFRVFNPVLQGRKFDPKGDYVKRWVPELARVPERRVHSPHEMTTDEQKIARCRVGVDYPAPMVDHARQRTFALEMFKQAGD